MKKAPKQIANRKLVVRREVIVQLERLELTKVVGGNPQDDSSSPPRCPPVEPGA